MITGEIIYSRVLYWIVYISFACFSCWEQTKTNWRVKCRWCSLIWQC